MCFVFTYKLPIKNENKTKSIPLELRGDDLEILEDIEGFIPDDRVDILLYLSDIKHQIEDKILD